MAFETIVRNYVLTYLDWNDKRVTKVIASTNPGNVFASAKRRKDCKRILSVKVQQR